MNSEVAGEKICFFFHTKADFSLSEKYTKIRNEKPPHKRLDIYRATLYIPHSKAFYLKKKTTSGGTKSRSLLQLPQTR